MKQRLIGKSIIFISGAILLSNSAALAQSRSSFARDRNDAVSDAIAREFRPTGIRTPGAVLYPTLRIGAEYNDNIYYNEKNKTDDFVLSVAPEITMNSNWSRNRLDFVARANYKNYTSNSDENNTSVYLSADGQIDTVGFSRIIGNVNFINSYEPRGEETSDFNAAEPINYKVSGVKAGYVYEFNRLRASVIGNYSNINYKDVKSFNGTTIDQDYRDRNETTLTLKGEYAISPDKSVFISYEPGKVEYDNKSGTIDRSSKTNRVYLGTNFDITQLIRGEVKVGYYNMNYDDPAYSTDSGLSYSGNIQYFPTRLTTVNVGFGRTSNESAISTSSGYILDNISVGLDHALTRRLLISGNIAYSTSEYNNISRNDDRYRLTTALNYRFNNLLALRLSYDYYKMESSGANSVSPFTDNIVRMTASYTY